MKLIVGTDSTWSLRALIAARLANLGIHVEVIDLRKPDYKSRIQSSSPAGLVPILMDGELVIHDSLSIVEYLNERSAGRLYPAESGARALARSLCAELHSGFFHLREQCPFTLDQIEGSPAMNDALGRDIERVNCIFRQATGPFMFGDAGAVDGFYAVLAQRLKTYNVVLSSEAERYQKTLLTWPLLQEALNEAWLWREI